MLKYFCRILLVILAVAVFFCGACLAENGLNIVCTSFPCYDFVRAIATEDDTVELLIRPGTEVHSYEPTTGDIMSISGCDLFVCIGGESDAWADDILDSFGEDAPAVLRLIDSVEAVEEEITDGMTAGEEHCDAETEYDEHIWTSPENAVKMVNAAADAMCALNDSTAYRDNAAAYCGEIREVDAQIRDIVTNGVRNEIVFADRFPFLYFVRQYNLNYSAAFPSCSTEVEPSAKTLAYLIDKVESDAIPVIYTIEMSNQKTAQTIAEETGAQILTFYSAQTVTDADFAAGETYATLMRKNAEALEKGLN